MLLCSKASVMLSIQVPGDVQVWLCLAERLGFDSSIYDSDSIPNLDVLSRYFDSSQRGLLRVFHLFDKDEDSCLSFEEIARGLKQQALFTLSETTAGKEAFAELYTLIEQTKGGVRPPEFVWALRNLRLAALMHGYMNRVKEDFPVKEGTKYWLMFNLHEYKEDKIVSRCPIEAPVKFLFEVDKVGVSFAEEAVVDGPSDSKRSPTSQSLGQTMRVRWLHCHDPARKAVLGLAMKYGIDPRFVFDIFFLWREQARADIVQAIPRSVDPHLESSLKQSVNQLFLVVPVLRLTQRSEQSCRPYEAWRRLKRSGQGRHAAPPCVIAEVEHCNLAILLHTASYGKGMSDASNTIMMSFTSEWSRLSKLVTDDIPAPETDNLGEFQALKLQSELKGTPQLSPLGSFEPDNSMQNIDPLSAFRKILAPLNTGYSHLRTGDAQTLLLKTLCEISEDYITVAKAYDYGLYVLQKRLDRQRDRMSQKDVRKIRKSLRQLAHLYRLVSPVLAVTDTLSKVQFSGDAALYLSDIRGNVNRFLDDAIAHKELTKGMIEQFQNFCESKTSQILYWLAIVTTLFAPGEFLASVYGMNFRYNEEASLPELNWEYGYLYFWLLVISITGVIFAIIRYLSRSY